MSVEKRPEKGTPEYDLWRKEKAKKRAQDLLSNESEFDQEGVLSGGKDSLRDKNINSDPKLKIER